MKDSPYFTFFMVFKLMMVLVGFILTVYAQVKDVQYDRDVKEIEKIPNESERLQKLQELEDGHQDVITFTLVALILLFLETLSTSSVQLYLYLFNNTEVHRLTKRIEKLERLI